jgi:hypothetical protein
MNGGLLRQPPFQFQTSELWCLLGLPSEKLVIHIWLANTAPSAGSIISSEAESKSGPTAQQTSSPIGSFSLSSRANW